MTLFVCWALCIVQALGFIAAIRIVRGGARNGPPPDELKTPGVPREFVSGEWEPLP